MIFQYGDRNVIFDNGNNQPGDILQRRESGGWEFFRPEGELMLAPINLDELPFGEYRLVGSGPEPVDTAD